MPKKDFTQIALGVVKRATEEEAKEKPKKDKKVEEDTASKEPKGAAKKAPRPKQ